MKTATKGIQNHHKSITKGRVSAHAHRGRVKPREIGMSEPCDPATPAVLTLELFHPTLNMIYSLDAAAQLAGVSRHALLVYCRVGLVQPVLQPPYDVMAFTGEAIQTVRRIQHVQAAYGNGVAWIKAILCLLEAVERLRSEVQCLRDPGAQGVPAKHA